MPDGPPQMTDLVALAIEDARARRQALMELLRFQDQQAMTLLGIYATLAIACVSGAAAAMAIKTNAASIFAASLTGPAILFALGGLYCCQALKSTTITLPGREAAFWVWVQDNNVTAHDAARRYIEATQTSEPSNDETNAQISYWMHRAKMCAPTAPLAGATSASLFALLRWSFGL